MKNYKYYVIDYYYSTGKLANITGFNSIKAAYKYMRYPIRFIYQVKIVHRVVFENAINLEEERMAARSWGIFE